MRMKKELKYYTDIDIIRVFSCIVILLYHLGILKGGYLAVCAFFVLSGYLSSISLFKKNKISLLEYFKNKLVHLYLPLFIFVCLSIVIISFIPSINWIYMKPEATSVLLGYNNYWQIGANIDYFASHNQSPFMHLWFMAILLQFDLIYPFIFIILKKIGDKIHRIIPCFITFILSILSLIYFIISFKNNGIMFTYYDTFTRVNALLFGAWLGFIHSYYKPITIKNYILKRFVFCLYLLVLLFMYIFINSASNYLVICMIITSIITLRLLDYANTDAKNIYSINLKDKIFKFFANISYEVYLYQYLVIFIISLLHLDRYLEIICVIGITLIFSFLIHYATSFSKKNIIFSILSIIIILFSIDGFYIFIKATDNTAEMNRLKEQLNQNELMMSNKQKEYLENQEKEKENWNEVLLNLENDEKALYEYVRNIPITGIGDSVMLGAVGDLYDRFSNGYFDAKVSRTDYEAPRIMRELKENGMLGDFIVIGLGTNGMCYESCKYEMLNIAEGRNIIWLTVTNDDDVNVNSFLKSFASRYDNLNIIDWENISRGHDDYFYADGIHLTSTGRQAYTNVIYDYIYNIYLNDFNNKRNSIINEHNNQLLKKISFYGNDLILYNFDNINNVFSDAQFNIKDYTYESLKYDILNNLDNINNNVVIAMDSTFEISNEQYIELCNILGDRKIFIVDINNDHLHIDGVNIIDFYNEIKNDNDYLMIDKVHLSDKGNSKLLEFLIEKVKKEIQ